jgi:hypothetical protein
MKTCEHMLSARNKESAMRLIRAHFVNYRKKYGITKWEWKVKPEVQKYEGKGNISAGKWRAYARISFE